MCAAKKGNPVRTAKMSRELMLGDKDVAASTVMVYSNNGINEEIKIEGLHPKSNEEIFTNGEINWNSSVIYKIVDFTGKAEIGKVTLDSMKKNNITLKIEKIMWQKEPKQEPMEVDIDPGLEAEEEEEEIIPTPPPVVKTAPPAPPTPAPAPATAPVQEKAVSVPKQKASISSAPAPKAPATPSVKLATPADAGNNENYRRLLVHSMDICRDYDLGADMDDSIDRLKEELASQGVTNYLDKATIDALDQLRALKEKGINLEHFIKLL